MSEIKFDLNAWKEANELINLSSREKVVLL